MENGFVTTATSSPGFATSQVAVRLADEKELRTAPRKRHRESREPLLPNLTNHTTGIPGRKHRRAHPASPRFPRRSPPSIRSEHPVKSALRPRPTRRTRSRLACRTPAFAGTPHSAGASAYRLHRRTEHCVVADPDRAHVQHHAVEVEEYPLPELDVRPVIAIEWRPGSTPSPRPSPSTRPGCAAGRPARLHSSHSAIGTGREPVSAPRSTRDRARYGFPREHFFPFRHELTARFA